MISDFMESTAVGQNIYGTCRMIGPCMASVGTLSVKRFIAT